jgi:Tol biopolymer transport system component
MRTHTGHLQGSCWLVLSLVTVACSMPAQADDSLSGRGAVTVLASKDSQGRRSHSSFTFDPALSRTGRYVAFSTDARLVPEDRNHKYNIYFRDRRTGTTVLVDHTPAGAAGAGLGHSPVIVATDDEVVFESSAPDLVARDGNDAADVFVWNRRTGMVQRVSGSGPTVRGGFGPSVSRDGRFVAYASHLADQPADLFHDEVFVHDRHTGDTVEASLALDGTRSFGRDPSISGNGRFVAFASPAPNLVPNDTNGTWDVFVRDMKTGDTVRASVDSKERQTSGGNFGHFAGWAPVINGDGHVVAFSSSSRMSPLDRNDGFDTYVRNLRSGQTLLAAVSDDETPNVVETNVNPTTTVMSGTGRYVAFESAAPLVGDDTNDVDDVFVRDLRSHTTTRVSVGEHGEQVPLAERPAISRNGAHVAFVSNFTVLSNRPPSDRFQIYIRLRWAQ